MQGYDYDFRTASADQSQLLNMIVKRALDVKDTRPLIRAYVSAAREDFEEENEENLSDNSKEFDKAFDEHIRMVKSEGAVEKLFEETFARVYRTRAGGTVGEALEAMDTSVTDRFYDDEIPSDIVVAVATALARRDAAEAIALRDEFRRRQRSETRVAAEPEEKPEAVEKGTVFLVHMKHGNWWSEIKRGVPLIITEGGAVGGRVKFKEQYDIMRSDNGMEAVLEAVKGKTGMYKLTLTNDRFRRALTVKLKA